MNCQEFVEFLIDYHEGTLPDDQRAEFDKHMELCPPCKDYLESYCNCVRLTSGVLKCTDDDVPKEVPEALVQAILTARRKECEGS